MTLILLRELYESRRDGKPSSSVHRLSTLPGMPTQRDQRIKRLLENLCEQGLVSKISIGESTGYQLNESGERWWIVHQPVLGLFKAIRKSDTNP